jgi:hypothetical protein
MSHSTILSISPGKLVREIDHMSNAWGMAPVIWDAMAQRYLDVRAYYWTQVDPERLSALARDPNVPIEQRAVMMMTFDLSYVAKANYSRAARDIRVWLDSYPWTIQHERTNHWPKIAELFESNPPHEALAIHQTSVSENPWRGESLDGGEGLLFGPLPWDDAFEVYEALSKVEGKQ